MVLKKYRIRYQKIFGIEKSIAFNIGNIWYRKSLGFGIDKNYQKNLGFVCFKHGFVKFGIGIGISFETFPIFLMVSVSVSKKFGIEKSIGFGIGKNLV